MALLSNGMLDENERRTRVTDWAVERGRTPDKGDHKKKAGKTSDLRLATRGEIISDEQFLLLYDTLGSNNSDFPYGNYQRFSLYSTNSARSPKESY